MTFGILPHLVDCKSNSDVEDDRMRRMLRAVAKVLAAILVTVAVWSEQLGRFILRHATQSPITPGADVVEEYENMAVATDVTPTLDQRIEGIQLIADQILHDRVLDPAALDGLSPKAIRWLEVLDEDMLRIVATAKPEALKKHLDNSYAIRGLVRFEDDAMTEYKRAVEADRLVPSRPARSRKDDVELFAPALGR